MAARIRITPWLRGMTLLGMAALAPGAAAQAAARAAPARDAQAMAALRQAIAAAGPVGAITDSVMVTTATPPAGGAAVTTTVTTKGADRIRFDSTDGTNARAAIADRGRNLVQTPRGWRAGPSPNTSHQRFTQLPGLMLSSELARADASAAWVADETLDGRAVAHVQLARQSALGDGRDAKRVQDSTLDVYIDSATFEVAKIAWTQLSDTDWRLGAPMAMEYSDYRQAPGPGGTLLLPFHFKTSFNGQPVSEATATSFQFNTGVADALFQAATPQPGVKPGGTQ